MQMNSMEVEGKRPPLGEPTDIDKRGDSAHQTDVESKLIRKSLVDAKGYARSDTSGLFKVVLAIGCVPVDAILRRGVTALSLCRDDREEYDDDGHVMRTGTFVCPRPFLANSICILHSRAGCAARSLWRPNKL